MIKAVLFDLDGTLLPVEIDELIARYIPHLHTRYAEHAPLPDFFRMVMSATGKMLANNDPSRTLSQVFWADFAPRMGDTAENLLAAAEDFYSTDFPKLKGCVLPDPAAIEAVRVAQQRGYRIALATNPIFPSVALWVRMRWAGIDAFKWDFIATQEDMSFGKPNTKYYAEIAKSLEVAPEECVMVGNNTKADLVASQIGMKTFLVTGLHIERPDGYPADWRGNLDDLVRLIARGFDE